jgi:hypothetical protein
MLHLTKVEKLFLLCPLIFMFQALLPVKKVKGDGAVSSSHYSQVVTCSREGEVGGRDCLKVIFLYERGNWVVSEVYS